MCYQMCSQLLELFGLGLDRVGHSGNAIPDVATHIFDALTQTSAIKQIHNLDALTQTSGKAFTKNFTLLLSIKLPRGVGSLK